MEEPMLTGSGSLPQRYRGVPVPAWFHEGTSRKLESMELRSTDVVLASWPKSGTHWVYKALRLLSADGGVSGGDMRLVEMLPPEALSAGQMPKKSPWNPTGEDHFDALLERESSAEPRILVSHAPASWLPLKPGRDGGKVVYVARDPRDVIVSNYFFMGTPKDGWNGSMNRFLAPAERTPNAFGGWFEHVADYEALVAALGPKRALLIEYEEMHANLMGQLRRLAAFLGPLAEDRLATDTAGICAALGFDSMREASGDAKIFLRKGQPGGWREHFSGDDAARVAAAVRERLPASSSTVGLSSWRKDM